MVKFWLIVARFRRAYLTTAGGSAPITRPAAITIGIARQLRSARDERARSRGAITVLAHSSGCRAQNSTHPARGRVTSETRHGRAARDPATAGGASMVLAANAAINTVPNFALKGLEITVAIGPPRTTLRECGLAR